MQFQTNSLKQTQKIAGLFVLEVLTAKIPRKNALVIALQGDLGAGKTSFTQGFMKGAGVKGKITSPTFVLMKNYKLRIKNSGNYKNIFHIDCYRIKKAEELSGLGLKEITQNPQNIVLIEWPERIKKYLPHTKKNLFSAMPTEVFKKNKLTKIKKDIHKFLVGGLPKNHFLIEFKHDKGENERTIYFKAK